MSQLSNRELKSQVREFWNELSCDAQVASAPKFSFEYFEEIEAFRYHDQPFIHSFAQFSRYRGKRVLEVGFGSGTDFIQWLRAGAHGSGIDLTAEGLENLTRRIEIYGLPQPEKILEADAEELPFPSDHFDLGYSFGVLHHSPDTEKAVAELVRVVRPGGEIKIMVYNRHSIYVFNQWVKCGLLRGKPFQTLKSILWNHIESTGTKGYARSELRAMFSRLPLDPVVVHTEATSADYLSASKFALLNAIYRACLRLSSGGRDWSPEDYAERSRAGISSRRNSRSRQRERIVFTGNRLGFFHCITAKKMPMTR